MMEKYVLALDQGTTSSRAILYDGRMNTVGTAQREFAQHFPRPGWVEHDPREIWESQRGVLMQVLAETGTAAADVAAIGITNQRETTVVWDRKTGEPVCNAIVWQDRRTAPVCERLKADGLEEHVRTHTGLVVDAYFSATKIHWMLENVPGARGRAENGDLLFGTVDTWLVWNLTGGRVHATDFTNASRTMLYDIRRRRWDGTMLAALGIPASMLPEVRSSAGPFGTCSLDGADIPVSGIAGDQQAALFGQGCVAPGAVKNTYGTGCFLLMNTGSDPVASTRGLLTTLACDAAGRPCYALEGSVFIAGAAVQWLRDGLKMIGRASETDALAQAAGDAHDVYVVPAFAGLGAPYWDMYARGAMFGLTRDTGREHIARAVLESLAYQTCDVLHAMEQDAGTVLNGLRVDGGAAANNYLMQFQADMLGVPVTRPRQLETTARGAALLAGLGAGVLDPRSSAGPVEGDTVYRPAMGTEQRAELYAGWKKAVERSMGWAAR